jgi:hypothetical protein
MEPPPRPSSTRNTASPQSPLSESEQDTSRRPSAPDLQQAQRTSQSELPSFAGSLPDGLLQEPSLGEQYPPESSISSLHDISALVMSRHQSGSNPPDRNPSIQLLSPESARNPRRMSQVSPGFIFVIFPMSALWIWPFIPSHFFFPMSGPLFLSYRHHILISGTR